MTSKQITTSNLRRKLIECPNLLKPYQVVWFANIPKANKVVSKSSETLRKFHCLSEASLKFLVGGLFAY